MDIFNACKNLNNHKYLFNTTAICAFFFWVRYLFLRIAKKKRNEKKSNATVWI